ncbi:MAG: hypothetical protein AAGD34_07290 [Pseudomonadota bacterium]
MTLRLLSLLCVCVAFCVPAQAQGVPFEAAFERELKSLMLNLSCGINRSERVEVLFVGVTRDDPHISESTRRDINARAINEINLTGSFRANPIEVMGNIASMVGGTVAADELRNTIAERRSAPALLMMSARRPDSDVMELKVDLSGREGDGGYTCTQTGSLYLDVRTLEERQRPADFELMTLKGATQQAMAQLSTAMPADQPIGLNVSVNMDGTCSFSRQLGPQVRAAIADSRRAARRTGGSAPAIMSAEGAKNTLSVSVWPSGLKPEILSIEYTVMREGVFVDTTFRNVVVNPTLLRGCIKTPEEAAAAQEAERQAELEAARRQAAEKAAAEAAAKAATRQAQAAARAAAEEEKRRLAAERAAIEKRQQAALARERAEEAERKRTEALERQLKEMQERLEAMQREQRQQEAREREQAEMARKQREARERAERERKERAERDRLLAEQRAERERNEREAAARQEAERVAAEREAAEAAAAADENLTPIQRQEKLWWSSAEARAEAARNPSTEPQDTRTREEIAQDERQWWAARSGPRTPKPKPAVAPAVTPAATPALFRAVSRCDACDIEGYGEGRTVDEAIDKAINQCIARGGRADNCRDNHWLE